MSLERMANQTTSFLREHTKTAELIAKQADRIKEQKRDLEQMQEVSQCLERFGQRSLEYTMIGRRRTMQQRGRHMQYRQKRDRSQDHTDMQLRTSIVSWIASCSTDRRCHMS